MAKKRSNLKLVYEETVVPHKSLPSPKSFSPQSLVNIKAETEPQAQFFDSFFRNTDIIFQAGSPGTGKTLVAIYGALMQVYDKDTPYDRLILVRSAVQSRQIGFLKGTEEEKNEAYEAIYEGMFDEIHRYKSNNYKNLKELGKVEFYNTSFLRGRTFDRAIICADESQNLSYSELYTIMSRVGVHSKIVFCGDYKQADLKGNEKEGFHKFLKVLETMPEGMTDIITYRPEHILRSDVVKAFIMAEEKLYG